MFCTKCGNEIKGGAFCGMCGAKVTDSVLQNATPIQTPSTTTQTPFQLSGFMKRFLALVVVLFAAIAVVLGIIMVLRILDESGARLNG